MQAQTMTVPTLKTERLTLRPLHAGDAGLIAFYVGDFRVASNLSVVPHPYPPGAAEAFIAGALRDGDEFVWALDLAGELIGVVSITLAGEGVGNVGYWLAPQFWGAGFLPEALEAVLAGYAAGRFSTLMAFVHQGNHGSARVLIKCGFEYTGDTESYSVARCAMVRNWVYRLTLPLPRP